MNRDDLHRLIPEKQLLILGFGKEGQSSYRFLKKYFPDLKIVVTDHNRSIEPLLLNEGVDTYKLGTDYLKLADEFPLVIKSPGIPFSLLDPIRRTTRITSQTELFLQLFRDQTIGVTGTKGKSTVASLIQQILSDDGRDSMLLGNIGVPPLDMAERINEDTPVVFEMSSHQLDGIGVSPKIAVFLNLYEEHLDHYASYEAYRNAKYTIFKYQHKGDWLIANDDDPDVLKQFADSRTGAGYMSFSGSVPKTTGAVLFGDAGVKFVYNGIESRYDFSRRKAIPGKHNLYNIMAAVCAAKLLETDDSALERSVNNFDGLPHRMEYLGQHGGIHFYNDSIATIPEATIEALKTIGRVDTLILGGKDRGINYTKLIDFLSDDRVGNIILIGEVGTLLGNALAKKAGSNPELFKVASFDGLDQIIRKCTPENGTCLLSPAASSYDMFSNFEHRGNAFKKIAENM